MLTSKNIYFILEFSTEWNAEGLVSHLESEEHEGGGGLPQEVGQLYGEEKHPHRKTSNVGIQTK